MTPIPSEAKPVVEAIRRDEKHTPGPWRFEVNVKSKEVNLCGGRPQFDLTVMGFERWGMSGAAPTFLDRNDPRGMTLITRAEKFAVPMAGRAHHKEWFQGLNHPDARLIEAAPDLLEAATLTEAILAECFGGNPDEVAEKNPAIAGILRLLRPAIAKATAK